MRILTGVFTGALLSVTGIVALCMSCSGQEHGALQDGGNAESSLPFLDADAMPPPGSFCSLPGSIVQTPSGLKVVPGADSVSPPVRARSSPT